jgi:hypothetical protein
MWKSFFWILKEMIPMENQDKEVEKKYNVEFTKKGVKRFIKSFNLLLCSRVRRL